MFCDQLYNECVIKKTLLISSKFLFCSLLRSNTFFLSKKKPFEILYKHIPSTLRNRYKNRDGVRDISFDLSEVVHYGSILLLNKNCLTALVRIICHALSFVYIHCRVKPILEGKMNNNKKIYFSNKKYRPDIHD